MVSWAPAATHFPWIYAGADNGAVEFPPTDRTAREMERYEEGYGYGYGYGVGWDEEIQ